MSKERKAPDGAFLFCLSGTLLDRDFATRVHRPLRAHDPGPVYASGDDVTLLPGDRAGLLDGSSISAAEVSGVSGLFCERDPTVTAVEIQALLHGHGWPTLELTLPVISQ